MLFGLKLRQSALSLLLLLVLVGFSALESWGFLGVGLGLYAGLAVLKFPGFPLFALSLLFWLAAVGVSFQGMKSLTDVTANLAYLFLLLGVGLELLHPLAQPRSRVERSRQIYQIAKAYGSESQLVFGLILLVVVGLSWNFLAGRVPLTFASFAIGADSLVFPLVRLPILLGIVYQVDSLWIKWFLLMIVVGSTFITWLLVKYLLSLPTVPKRRCFSVLAIAIAFFYLFQPWAFDRRSGLLVWLVYPLFPVLLLFFVKFNDWLLKKV